MKKFNHYQPNIQTALLVSIGVALVLSVYVAYAFFRLNKEFGKLEAGNTELVLRLEEVTQDRINLYELSKYQQSIIDGFQGQIADIGNTVGVLNKLSQTDEELLKKYSKIYFLNENYRPAELSAIDTKYLYEKDDAYTHAKVLPFLNKLLESARSSGIELLIASAFRSFDTQASLKSEYKIVYGAGTANQFSADQGYSEHQLGTAVDFTTPAIGGTFSKFASDPAFKWLEDNAHKYGFTLSYPKNNTYYIFEPWHWRFVGVELAEYLHANDKHFYDLDQRDIDTYLIKLFD